MEKGLSKQTMKNSFWAVTIIATAMGCGEKTETQAIDSNQQASSITKEEVCACISEMEAVLDQVLADAEGQELTIEDWMSRIETSAADCMKEDRGEAGGQQFVNLQSECPRFDQYSSKIESFRLKLMELKEKVRPEPAIQSMDDVAPGGAQELLDKLRQKRD